MPKFNKFFIFFLILLIGILLTGCTRKVVEEDKISIKDIVDIVEEPLEEIPEETFSKSTESGGDLAGEVPHFLLENFTGDDLFKVDHAGNIYGGSVKSCETIETDSNGLFSCGNDQDSNLSGANIREETRDYFVNVTGDTMSGNLNMNGNNISADTLTAGKINLGKDNFITNQSFNGLWDTTIVNGRPSTNNNLLFAVCGNGSTGVCMPHFWIQNAGGEQASGVSRSFMIVNEDPLLQNTTNLTSCRGYMETVGEILQIDCNTTTTGADLLVGDDMQVVGDVWVKDTENDWHFLTRTLSVIDRLFSNLLLNDVNATLEGDRFHFIDRENNTLIININAEETITTFRNDSIDLTPGTNTTPQMNFVYYLNGASPTLTVAATEPTANYAEIGRIIMGATNYAYGSVIDKQSEDKALRGIFSRLYDEGPQYVSGYSQQVNTTTINFSLGGVMTVITHRHTGTTLLSTSDRYFFIDDNGATYTQSFNINDMSEYSDGTAISNNKYFNVVFGVVHNDLGSNRMMALVQSLGGAAEYGSIIDAEVDGLDLARFFPADTDLKNMFIPIARVVMQRTVGATVNTIQTLSNGQLYRDTRGVTSTAGGSGSPSISNHNELNNLLWSVAGHTIDTAVDLAKNDLDNLGNINLAWGNLTDADNVAFNNITVATNMTVEDCIFFGSGGKICSGT